MNTVEELANKIYQIIPENLWPEKYNANAYKMCYFISKKIIYSVTSGHKNSLSNSKLDGLVELIHIDPKKVYQRGYKRYGSNNMEHDLQNQKDLIPITCSRINNDEFFLFDGHHRLRAYSAAKKDALALVISIKPGNGKIEIKSEFQTASPSSSEPLAD